VWDDDRFSLDEVEDFVKFLFPNCRVRQLKLRLGQVVGDFALKLLNFNEIKEY
jgi:hypothetical protein